ncbi:MAG: DNA repair protein RecO [Treponema sp.]|jgi:DNA repair protein RecO (recombination protein O)|nr:DNA repair protein RecO [Treponema sp.]
MLRTAVYSALILRSRPSGESNREIYLLTAEEGIIRATVFGGPKSKLRAHAAPFNSGQVWIYINPSKNSAKVNDFDVHSWRPGLRELYERTMAAGGIADTILATHGGGGAWDTALKLAAGALDTLENANEELCSRILIHFLWRWADFLGICPQIGHCAVCGKKADDSPLWFCADENAALCETCAAGEHGHTAFLRLDPGCRRWLAAVGTIETSLLYRYSMDNKSFDEAKSLTAAVLSDALGRRLTSWDW